MRDGTILLVEDNPDDEILALRALRRNRITNAVAVSRDGQAALDYLFDTRHAPPALILLDLNLPKINGLEVLRRIRSEPRLKLVPVVVLTSSREAQDLVRGYQLGCNSYVCKPVDFDQFSQAVLQLGLYWLLLNEPPPAIDDSCPSA